MCCSFYFSVSISRAPVKVICRLWVLQVFRDGGGGGDSSEEEEREGAAEWQEELMDLGSSEPFVPTGAFCRALDREAEFDEADELASHTLHAGGSNFDAKPARSMEVCTRLRMAKYVHMPSPLRK